MKIIVSAFCVFSLTSCYHIYYAPNTPNIMQFTEKQEIRINGGIIGGFESEFTGADLQLAYAPAKHIGVMINGFTAAEKENNSSNEIEKGSGSYGEIGLGYFTAFDKKKEWTFEIYGGAGKGKVNNEYGSSERSKVAINKWFLQPGFGYKSDHVEIAFAPKLAYVNWKVKSSNVLGSDASTDLEYIRMTRDFFSFEPGLILRIGGKQIKGQLGFTIGSISVNEYIFNYEAPTESIVAYMGLSVNLSGKKKLKVVSTETR